MAKKQFKADRTEWMTIFFADFVIGDTEVFCCVKNLADLVDPE
jgi:hypothetical protein